ncbi:hypothetical protein Nepgr_018644 [Nepenthes gracilis]|uniref:Uncharacterized protein n=1 Tax=Nepenthes gracilis TaxID=150966 RepID=A0AAD3SRQ9_NEPGR|nr:hypothetical protein Nepgr_018644 [Nepenthes gracilis]
MNELEEPSKNVLLPQLVAADAASLPAGSFDMDGKLEFDFNECLNMEDDKLAAAAKGPFIPSEGLLTNKGSPRWKGLAATSAFRPAEPRKVTETQSTFDTDLNVADERILEGTGYHSSAEGKSSHKNDAHLTVGPMGTLFEVSLPQAKSSLKNVFSNSHGKDFDLNNGRAAEEPIGPNSHHVTRSRGLTSLCSLLFERTTLKWRIFLQAILPGSLSQQSANPLLQMLIRNLGRRLLLLRLSRWLHFSTQHSHLEPALPDMPLQFLLNVLVLVLPDISHNGGGVKSSRNFGGRRLNLNAGACVPNVEGRDKKMVIPSRTVHGINAGSVLRS